MWWKIKNQLLIFMKVCLFVGIFVALYTYQVITKPSTCFDNVKNSDEHGIDCGGSCVLYCREEVGIPRIIEQGYVSQGKNHYQFYIKVDVPFARMISAKNNWSLEILNANKKTLIKEPIIIKGYITADRKTYIVSELIELAEKPTHTFWKQVLTKPYLRPNANFSNANIKIKNSMLSENELYTIIDGVISHDIKEEKYNYIDVLVFLFNKNDEVYAMSKQRLSQIIFNKDYPIHITFPKTSLSAPPARFIIVPQIVPLGFFK